MKILTNGYKNTFRGKIPDAGSEVFMLNLIPWVKKRRHTLTHLLFSGLPLETDKTTVKRYGRDHVWLKSYIGFRKIREAKSQRLPDSTLHTIKAAKNILEQEKPDAVLINGYAIYNWIILTAAAELKIPIFSILHGLWFTEIQTNTKTLNMTATGIRITKSMEADIARHSKKMFFVSQFSRDAYEKNIIKIPKGKAILMALPYNPVFESPTKPVNSGPQLNVGIVGRWDPIKNHPAFLAVAKRARELGLPWKFHAVTKIGKNLELNSLRTEYRKHITIHPAQSPAKLKSFYDKMDILLLPSKFDVFPTVVMESLLRNRLTIISDQVGWKTLYKKFGLGHLVTKFDNPDKIIQTITKYRSQRPPQALIKHIKKQHSPSVVFTELIKTLESNI